MTELTSLILQTFTQNKKLFRFSEQLVRFREFLNTSKMFLIVIPKEYFFFIIGM